MAFPMPELPPVTMAPFPLRVISFSFGPRVTLCGALESTPAGEVRSGLDFSSSPDRGDLTGTETGGDRRASALCEGAFRGRGSSTRALRGGRQPLWGLLGLDQLGDG